MATNGWIPSEESPRPPSSTDSGRVKVKDVAKEKETTGEEGLFKQPENREIGDGMLGVTVIERSICHVYRVSALCVQRRWAANPLS